MAWSAIRKATKEDFQRLDHAWKEFRAKHPEIDIWSPLYNGDLDEFECCNGTPPRRIRALNEAWKKRRLRLVGSREGIAYGYVGEHVE